MGKESRATQTDGKQISIASINLTKSNIKSQTILKKSISKQSTKKIEKRKVIKKQQRFWEPARKPIQQQWSAIDRFICGECYTTFTTRFAQTRHQKIYHSHKKQLKRELATYMRKQAEFNRQERQRKKQIKSQMEKKKRGRPANPFHYCDRCPKQFETACQKRDHQRRCKPWRNRKIFDQKNTDMTSPSTLNHDIPLSDDCEE